MYELVIIHGDKEEVVFTTEDPREAELKRQQHIRSLTHGFAEVREAKEVKPAKEPKEPKESKESKESKEKKKKK